MKLQKYHLWIVLTLFAVVLASIFVPPLFQYRVDIETGERHAPLFLESPDEHVSLLSTNKLNGTDVSKWQGYPVNYEKMYNAGIRFTFIRLGYSVGGYHYQDPYWQYNVKAALDAGLVVGCYYYFNPEGSNAAVQATFFADLYNNSDCQLPPVLDAEDDGNLSTTALADWYKLALDTLETKTGKRPIIYTGTWFWNPEVARRTYWKNYDLWVAQYFSSPDYEPTLPYDWDEYWFHQWTSSGSCTIYGCLSTYIDLDTFRGTLDDLLKRYNLYENTTVSVDFDPGRYFIFSDVPFTLTYTDDGLEFGELEVITLPLVLK